MAQGPPADARRRNIARARGGDDGHRASQRCRKRVEEVFGWLKAVAGLAKVRLVGGWKIGLAAHTAGSAWNILRLCNIAKLRQGAA